jgi:hypothetical protein
MNHQKKTRQKRRNPVAKFAHRFNKEGEGMSKKTYRRKEKYKKDVELF